MMQRVLIGFLAPALVLFSSAPCAARPTPPVSMDVPVAQPTGPAPLVETVAGKVQGLRVRGVDRYLGIPYAEPPVGALRFRPPVAHAPWDGIQEAIGYGAPCIPLIAGGTAKPQDDFALMQMVALPSAPQAKLAQENCLYLNVWTPHADAGKRPVLVWIHGGGFAYGAGSFPVYEGTRLARRGDVVVVTLNHRLNLFGFMNLAGEGSPDYADSVNVGMLDIIEALKWVKANIAHFGGDPGNVTIAGESGGGAKVGHLLAIPAAHGLFQKAISQSGPGITGQDAQRVQSDSHAILERAGMKGFDPQWLQTVPADQLIKAALAMQAQWKQDVAVRLTTSVDGKILPRNPFVPDASPVSADVPLLIGSMKDEFTLFAARATPDFAKLTEAQMMEHATKQFGAQAPAMVAALRRAFPHYSPAYIDTQFPGMDYVHHIRQAAERKAAQRAAVYVYQLDWETPVGGGIFKTPHALDLPLMFDNVEVARPFVGPGPNAQRMADQMANAWIAFMRHGNPNTPILPHWPSYSAQHRAVMSFNLKSHIVIDPYREIHAIFDSTAQPSAKPAGQ